MNIEESLIELKNYIKDKTNPHFDNYGFATVRAKQIQAIETLLTAYEKEKEKNKKLIKQHAIEITDVGGNSIKIDLDGKIHNVYKIEEDKQ